MFLLPFHALLEYIISSSKSRVSEYNGLDKLGVPVDSGFSDQGIHCSSLDVGVHGV